MIHQLNIVKIMTKDIKVFQKNKKRKYNNMVMNDIKIYQKMKNNDLESSFD